MEKTNVMRILDQKKIPYHTMNMTIHRHIAEPRLARYVRARPESGL